jgi:hypothetical protein
MPASEHHFLLLMTARDSPSLELMLHTLAAPMPVDCVFNGLDVLATKNVTRHDQLDRRFLDMSPGRPTSAALTSHSRRLQCPILRPG